MKKKTRFRMPAHLKITLIFSAIIIIVLSAAYLYLNNTLKEHVYERIRGNLRRELLLSKSFLEIRSRESAGGVDFDTVADNISKDLNLRVTIIAPDGRVLGDSRLTRRRLEAVENHLYRPEVQEALLGRIGENRRFSNTVKMEMLYMATAFGAGKARGVVRLSVPLSDVALVSNRLKKILGISFLTAFAVMIFASFMASLFISRPIKEISLAARDIANGDFSRKILIRSNDEIGDLALAFNHMSEQIKSRISEVTSSKSRLEAVLFSMFDGVMVVDHKGEILFVNEGLKRIFPVPSNPLGKKPLEVIRNVEVQEIADKSLRLDKGVISTEITLLIPGELVFLVHATPIIRQGVKEGAVLVFHDITELRRLEKIRKDFVANVSHELRTPVSSIKGYVETLLGGALEERENARDFLKIIFSESGRLAQLIEDLLNLSKIESGKLRMDPGPLSLKSVVESLLPGLRKLAKQKSITISEEIPEGLPPIIADEKSIARVFLNLMDNAIKYTPENGKVTLKAAEKDNFLEVSVTDTGIGIPEKDIPRIFERFYRVDKARSRELGGTGLGLSIVKHIVQAHRGQVFVESLEGRGSTFTFTLPKA